MLRWPTEEGQEQAIKENMRFVYYLLNKLLHVPRSEYDDFVQIGTEGLIKAVKTFDDGKNVTFSTYAARCIKNEWYMTFRKRGKLENEVLFSDVTFYAGPEYEMLEIEDTLTTGEDITESIMDGMEFLDIINITLNMLEPREAMAIL